MEAVRRSAASGRPVDVRESWRKSASKKIRHRFQRFQKDKWPEGSCKPPGQHEEERGGSLIDVSEALAASNAATISIAYPVLTPDRIHFNPFMSTFPAG
jgi:hypothetical protein